MQRDEKLGLREAFGSFMTGVTVVTTTTDEGEPIGFTANSFSSVSLEPPLLLVSIAKTSTNHDHFARGKHFAINVLSEGQREVSNTFASRVSDRFANLEWHLSENQNPIIKDSSAWFDCLTHKVVDAGDHAILIGAIQNHQSTGLAGLGYYRGAYFSPAQLSTETFTSPQVVVSAVIGFQDEVLLEKAANGKWTIPFSAVEEGGTRKYLEQLLAEYQPDASANFIYSVYEDSEHNRQYICFLCNSPSRSPKKGEYVKLSDIEKLDFIDPALDSILMRYKNENVLQSYGIYFGSQEKGVVRQTIKEIE